MSERTQVETIVPLNHWPTTRQERDQIAKESYDAAVRLVHPGRVLSLLTTIRAVDPITQRPAIKMRWAVEAPESIQHQRSTFPAA